MNFATAIKQAFARTFTFGSTASRPEYWHFALFTFLLGIVLSVFDSVISASVGFKFTGLATASSILLFLPQLSLTARRFHDAGFSALWLLLYTVPLAALAYAGPTLMKLADETYMPTDAELVEAATSLLPFLALAFFVGIFFFVVSLLPSKSHAAGNRHAKPASGEPVIDLSAQGW
jgi:uncharacterized membrane protein YhaH (DUF805 family)